MHMHLTNIQVLLPYMGRHLTVVYNYSLIHRQGFSSLCGTTLLSTRGVLSVLINFGVSRHISACDGENHSSKSCSVTWQRETSNGFWRGS